MKLKEIRELIEFLNHIECYMNILKLIQLLLAVCHITQARFLK